MALRRMAALACAWLACAAAFPAAARVPDAAVRAFERVSADELHGYVETLAGDAFGGRGLGEAGNRAAEEYICGTLQRSGVTPAGAGGSCYQAVEVYRPSVGPRAALRVSGSGGTSVAEITLGADFYPL